MDFDLLSEAKSISGYMTDIRRAIHMEPELGNSEFNTASLIERALDADRIAHERIIGTAVVGCINGGLAGDTIAFRADMDALPVTEQTECAWRSHKAGVMHACGHDMHVAALLGAAKLIASHRDALKGNVKLFFQPDEEGDGGARRMIAAGCMQNPDVKVVYGAHCEPDLPVGSIGYRYGAAYAASNPFTITVHGSGAHGAEPHKGVDAIAIGAQIVTALHSIVARELAPTDFAVITVGSFNAGTRSNIIADTAVLKGIMRCYGDDMRRRLTDRVTTLTQSIAMSMRGSADVDIEWGYSGVVNDDTCVDVVRRAAADIIGAENVIAEPLPTLGTEDVGEFINVATGAFFHIGVGGKDGCAPLHSAHFDPDESALPILAAIYADIALTKR